MKINNKKMNKLNKKKSGKQNRNVQLKQKETNWVKKNHIIPYKVTKFSHLIIDNIFKQSKGWFTYMDVRFTDKEVRRYQLFESKILWRREREDIPMNNKYLLPSKWKDVEEKITSACIISEFTLIYSTIIIFFF